jgi:hypothetical protein
MLHKNSDSKGSVAKEVFGHELQGAWCQDELFAGKPPVAKHL